jgi:hypothetical protein
MVAAMSPARGVERFFSTHFQRVPTILEKLVASTVNGQVMGTANVPPTLIVAAGMRRVTGAVSRHSGLLLSP